jgi:hypothetical protein
MSDSVLNMIKRMDVPEAPEKKPIQSLIFGFGHRARSGKDSVVAAIIADRGHLYDVRRYSFASELKREVNQAALACGGMERLFTQPQEYVQENGNFLELPDWVVYDPEAPMDDPECGLGKQRLFLQWYGGEFRRGANPNYWINKLAQKISEEKPEIALVSDVRYLNEILFVQKYGETIKVERPDLPSLKGAAGVHASELALAEFDGWDAVIKNSGTLEDLRDEALFTFDMLMSSVPNTRSTS